MTGELIFFHILPYLKKILFLNQKNPNGMQWSSMADSYFYTEVQPSV